MNEVRETIDGYLARLDDALRREHEREREELLAEVRAHLEEAAARARDPEAAVRKAVGSLGDPDALARRLREGGDDRPAPDRVKRVLGMPYNFKPLTSEQIAARIWNPSDPRIFMPRVFGIGWTVNFGALAVLLRLVRPDDEEPVPFTNVPAAPLSLGLGVITALNLAVVAVALLLHPARTLPVHWGSGGPDGFAEPLVAALAFLGPAVALNAIALWRASTDRSRTERTLWVAFLVIALGICDGSYLVALSWALTGHALVSPGVPVFGGLVLAFFALVVYSRLGVRAEWERARVK